jgi:hypothetical protein
MTAVAVVRDWLLRFPVTVKARRMFGRNSFEGRTALTVTDSAVVVILRRSMREPQHRNHVLVLIVRKLDLELQFCRRIPERKPRLIARRGLRMAHGADRGLGAAEELRPMTTYASIVAGIILDIRKGNLVTRITRGSMLRRSVRKLRIIDGSHG